MSTALPSLDERLVSSAIGTLELFAVYLGTRLGLYEALREHGPMTVAELAGAAGIDARYAREWLEQQAVAGFIVVDDPDARRRRAALLDEPPSRSPHSPIGTIPSHVAPLADMVVGIGGSSIEVVDGLPVGRRRALCRLRADIRRGQGGINRPAFTDDLAGGGSRRSPTSMPASLGLAGPRRRARQRRGLGVDRAREGVPGRRGDRLRHRPGIGRRGPRDTPPSAARASVS